MKVILLQALRQENIGRLAALIVLVIGFGLLTDGLTYSYRGITNILLQSSVVGLAAIGQTFVMLTGSIDISLYGIGVLVSVLGASTMTSRFDLNVVGTPLPIGVGLLLMIAIGLAMGAVNGLLVTRLRVPSLIATLGTWQIGYGLAQLFGGGFTITGLPPALSVFGQASFAGISIPVLEMFLLFSLAYYILHHTTFGRAVYAVGGNPMSAHLSGLKIERILLLVFMISGLMVSLAAISIEGRLMSVSMRTLSGLQLDSIAAVAIGGVSVHGGRGSIIGVLLGTLILAVVDSGLGGMGVGTDIQNTVKGAIIVLAVSLEFFRVGIPMARAGA
jgi:ribose/xylose/arabinose/galactoside ABC-type transport system permease subunit